MQTAKPLSEKTLQLLKSRDPGFLRQLFIDTNPYLIRLAYSQNVFGEQAEEVVQEAWQVFFSRIEEFKGMSQLKTFIAGILINKIREYRRDVKKMIPEEDHEKLLSESFTSKGWWLRTPESPEKLFQSQEVGRAIQDCLQTLTDQQKKAFALKEIEQDSTENICENLQVSATNLGVLLFRAKEKMRMCLTRKHAGGRL